MAQRNYISLQFGDPQFGWLPVDFRCADFELQIRASNIPVDPIVQLGETLQYLMKGERRPSRIIWHLEPLCYYMQLARCAEHYQLEIFNSEGFDTTMYSLMCVEGDFETLILPFYKAYQAFSTLKVAPPHWQPVESNQLRALENLYRIKQKHLN